MNGIWREHFTKMTDTAFTAFVHLLAGEAADDARRRGMDNLKHALDELSHLTERPDGEKRSAPEP
jgi:hypothetical protein